MSGNLACLISGSPAFLRKGMATKTLSSRAGSPLCCSVWYSGDPLVQLLFCRLLCSQGKSEVVCQVWREPPCPLLVWISGPPNAGSNC